MEIISFNAYSLFDFHLFCSALAHSRSTLDPALLLCFPAAFCPLQRHPLQPEVPAVTAHRAVQPVQEQTRRQAGASDTAQVTWPPAGCRLCRTCLLQRLTRCAAPESEWRLLQDFGQSVKPPSQRLG